MQNRQNGFTLFELAVVLAILSILATLAVPNFMDEYNEKRAALTVQETQIIMDAARAFRADTGQWPGQPTCAGALAVLRSGGSPYLGGINTNNRYNSPYVTACNANSFTVRQTIIPDFDGVVANSLPGTLVSNTALNQVTSIVGVPGSESAIAGKLSRIVTGNPEDNRMRTTLLLGGNNIAEANNLTSNSVNTGTLTATGVNAGGVTTGGLTATGNIAANGQVRGNYLQSTGGATINGRLLTREFAIQGLAVAGAGCPTAGSMSTTSAGLSLTCQRGVWTRSSNWFDAPVSGGSGCLGSGGKGSFAVGTDGKLYVCR